MTDFFISYAREDKPFVERFYSVLDDNGYKAWVDWEGIPPSAEWMQEIYAAIDAADCFVFIISPDSVASEICQLELEHAINRHKRLVPVLHKETESSKIPHELASLNWLFISESDDPDVAVNQFIDVINTDLERVRAHTRLTVRAAEWEISNKDESLLLRGRDLNEAEQWQTSSMEGEPLPTRNQIHFIKSSRDAASKRQRKILISAVTGLLLMTVLAIIAWNQRGIAVDQRNQADQARSEVERRLMVSTAQVLAGAAPVQLTADNDERAALLARQAWLLNLRANGQVIGQIDDALRKVLSKPYFSTVLDDHKDVVRAVAFSPDGEHFVTGGNDHHIRLWKRDQLDSPVLMIKGHSGGITGLKFIAAGKQFVSSSMDGTIRFWSLKEPEKPIKILESGTKESFGELAINRSETMIAAGGRSAVRVWTLDGLNGEKASLKSLQLGGGSGASLAFSPDGKLLASGTLDGKIRIWQTNKFNQAPRILDPDSGGFLSLAYSPDGKMLAAGPAGLNVVLYDMQHLDQKPVILKGHNAWINTVIFSPDGQKLITGSGGEMMRGDNTVRVWDLNDLSKKPVVLGDHSASVYAAAISPDGQTLITGSKDRTARVWDLSEPYAKPDVLSGHIATVYDVAWSPDGQTLASVAGSFFATGDFTDPNAENRNLHLWKPGINDSAPTVFLGQGGIDHRVQFTNEGSLLGDLAYYLKYDKKDQPRWTIATLDQVYAKKAKGRLSVKKTVALSPNGKHVASLEGNNTVKLVNLLDQSSPPVSLPVSLKKIDGKVTVLEFSHDSQTLAAGSETGTVAIWDIQQTDQDPIQHHAHQGKIVTLAFSQDDQWLAAGGEQKVALVWDLKRMQKQPQENPLTLKGPESWILSLAFSNDNDQLAAASTDDTVRIWTLSNPDVMPVVLRGHQGGVRSVAFSPDGKTLASGSHDKDIFLWQYDTKALADHVCKVVGRNLTFPEWNQFVGSNYPYEKTCADLEIHHSLEEEARELAWRGKLGKSQQLLSRIKTLDPDYTKNPLMQPNKWRASHLLEEGHKAAKAAELDVAIGKYKQALQYDPELELVPENEAGRQAALLPLAEGDKLGKEGKFEEAIDQYKRAFDFDQGLSFDPQIRAGKLVAPKVLESARSLASQQKVDESITEFKRALELDPELELDPVAEAGRNAAPWVKRSAIRKARAGELVEALSLFEEVLQLDPSIKINPQEEVNKYAAEGYLEKARNAARKDDIQAAMSFFDQALNLNKTLKLDSAAEFIHYRIDGLMSEAESQADKGDYKGSLTIIDKAKKLDPELKINQKVLQQRAARFYFQQGEQRKDHRKKAESYRQAAELDPKNSRAWFALGYSLMQAGENESARNALLRHEALRKDNERELSDTWYNLGLLNQRLKDFVQTEFYSIKALETNDFNHRKRNFGDLHWRIAYAIDKQGRYAESEDWYRKSIPIYNSIGDQKSVASLQNNLAGTLEDQGKMKDAELAYREALKIAERIGLVAQVNRATKGVERITGTAVEN